MLIGVDDISYDVITLGMCFSMFVYIRGRFRFTLTGGSLTARSTGATGELEVEFKFQRRSCKFSFLFPPRSQTARAPRRACSLASRTWIPDFNRQRDSGFLVLNCGFQCPIFRIPKAQISQIPESGLP